MIIPTLRRRQAIVGAAGLLTLAALPALAQVATDSTTGSSMLKIILVPRRHPDMTRPQFFDYLANKHASLVKSVPEFTRYLRRYVQNHSRLAQDGADVTTPFQRAVDRDSVIELWFDDGHSFHRALAEPRYQEVIRPDEARFNDLPNLIVLATTEVAGLPAQGGPTGFKLFDVMKRKADIDRTTFLARWQRHSELLRSRSAYRLAARKSVLNAIVADDSNPFGQPADFDGVMETWLGRFADAGVIAKLRLDDPELAASEVSFVDASASFSVLAVENPVINPPAWASAIAAR
jgi:hypothetical protein